MSETYIISHAHGNYDIAKGTSNGPYLRGVVIRQLGACLGSNSYPNADVRENHDVRSVEHGIIFPPSRLNPNCYPTAKLDE